MKYSEKNAEVSNILDLNVIWLVRIILNIKSFLGRTDLHKMVRGRVMKWRGGGLEGFTWDFWREWSKNTYKMEINKISKNIIVIIYLF